MKTPEKEAKIRHGIVNFERRKFPRFSVDLPIEYCRIDTPVHLTARTLDIGEGGLLIYFSERMEIGQRLTLKLFFSMGSKLNTIELLVEVVWVDMHLDDKWGDYRSGVKFADISPEDMTTLKNFLISLSQPPYTK